MTQNGEDLIVKNHLFKRKNRELTRVCSLKFLLPAPLELQQTNVLEKPMRSLTLDLKAKLILSESTFMRSLCGINVQKC